MTEQPVSVRGAGTSVVTYRFGGRDYPLKTVARCHTCMSPYRFEIEQAIVAGRTYKKISELVASYGDEENPTAVSIRSITDHYHNGHMPLELSETRAIVEARAKRVGKSIADSEESLVDGVTLLSTVIQKTFEAIANGTIEPGVRDGIRAAKMLADLGEYDGSNVDQQAFVTAFIQYHETASQLMDDETFQRFGRMLEDNPVLRALAARFEGEEEPEPVTGEVTERSDEPVESSSGDS